jgi:hypothetical protein
MARWPFWGIKGSFRGQFWEVFCWPLQNSLVFGVPERFSALSSESP